MSDVVELPPWLNLAILSAIVLYFALFIYAGQTGNVTARLTSQVVFALVALAVGGVLFLQAKERFAPSRGAGLCLITGGVAQLVAVGRADPALDSVASIAVFAGIALYVVAVWQAKK